MNQFSVTVYVSYDSTSKRIVFFGDSPYITSMENGARAEIKVPYSEGIPERTISCQLKGEGTFPEASQAVEWTHPPHEPTWARVERSSDKEVKIVDFWKPDDEPKDASFIVGVLDGGTIVKSQDPTIINDPPNK